MGNDLTQDQIIALLHRLVEKEGSQRKAAKRIGISVGHLNNIITGDNPPSPVVLEFFGLRREIVYRKK